MAQPLDQPAAPKRAQRAIPAPRPAALTPARPPENDEDRVLNLSLRPKSFEEFVGQAQVVENLRVAIQAAKRREEPLEHLLLDGPPGLGKTSMAHLLAH